ncbi:MAG: SIS domain-containing protein [Pseudomonadota bacterium]
MTGPGQYMAREMAEGATVFARAAAQSLAPMDRPQAIYTFARGSSDAAALILAYAYMRRLKIPVTSLPPSVFSLGGGLAMENALALAVSQSGRSDDLVACVKGGGRSVAITNAPQSPVGQAADVVLPIGAGEERAVPATKTVLGAIGAGLALLTALDPDAHAERDAAIRHFEAPLAPLPGSDTLVGALQDAEHIYVLGRQEGYGLAQEIALKLKETAALHAEAYSASEVLHGPLQLSIRPMMVLVLDLDHGPSHASLDAAEARFQAEGARVFRIGAAELEGADLTPPAKAALLLYALYPVIHSVALALGYDPDRPSTLSKVTRTE